MRLLILFFILLFSSFFSFILAKNLNLQEDYIYLLKEGESYSSIKKSLKNLDITIPFVIDLYFYLTGSDKSLRKGEYKLEKNSNLFVISNNLSEGNVFYRSFYIPEGSEVSQFLSLEEQNKFCKFKGLDDCKLEGMLHPNTYFYEAGENLNNILNEAFNIQLLIAEEQFKKLNTNKLVKNVYELIILASILEKESCFEERSLISGVIYNRLKKRMKLQIDSTVIYGIKDFDGNLTKLNLKNKTPFNTYTNFGLPPTPISMPSKSSLIAAGNPLKSDYFYFVSKGKCAHEFSVDYSDHLKAIQKYQLN